MKHVTAKHIAISLAFMTLLCTIGLSKPGRLALGHLVSLMSSSNSAKGTVKEMAPSGTLAAGATANDDVERRARARHGWDSTIANSVMRGTVTYYDVDGNVTDRADITVYRKYPQLLRIEILRNGTLDVLGFDQVRAWKLGAINITEEDARDIRSFLRIGPERLFVTRGEGSPYREAGLRVEDSAPSDAGSVSSVILEQVQMEDTLGPAPNTGRAGDRRNIYYYVDHDSSTVLTARWLEPDDPRRRIGDPNTSLTDVRVDFGGWQRVSGVLWPFEIRHQFGGRVDYRIQLNRVRVNQPIVDSLFQP